MTDFDPHDYYNHLKPREAIEKASESTHKEELSPSGTKRGQTAKSAEKARQAHLQAMKDLGL